MSQHREATPIASWLPIIALCGGSVFLWILVGVWLDKHPAPKQSDIRWPIFSASLTGAIAGALLLWRGCSRSAWQSAGVVGLAFVMWRIVYFPNMVFAGFLASLFEMVLHAMQPDLVLLYPVFLLSVFGLHLGCLWFLSLGFGPASVLRLGRLRCNISRRAMATVAGPMLLVAILVSFTDEDDWTLLPDHPTVVAEPLPKVGTPRHNPYLTCAVEANRPIPQRVLLLCAGVTYTFIPNSPWAGAVKGTLEEMMNRNPHAGSQQRIREHYMAYLVAHRALHRKP